VRNFHAISAKIKKVFLVYQLHHRRFRIKHASPQEQTTKQGGAKEGHVGNGRKRHKEEEVDEIREVHVESNCPQCHIELNYKDTQERSVLDIDPIVLKKVLYRLERRECPCCGASVTAKTKDALPRASVENSLIAEIVDSHYVQGIAAWESMFTLGIELWDSCGFIASGSCSFFTSDVEVERRLSKLFCSPCRRNSLARVMEETVIVGFF
jgi:ssDNA-binding Zn-finger/Zn-ribbon topoisomerase 1